MQERPQWQCVQGAFLMIELINISFSYNPKIVLKDINLKINKGERAVLLGSNGCGKTTLFKIIDGLLFPKEGKYFFNNLLIDKNFFNKNENTKIFRSSVVMLFQSPDVMLFNPTCFDEIGFGLRQLGKKEEEVKEKVSYWLDVLGIKKYEKIPPFELSGGEKQKLAIASILAIEPSLVLLDEPMANLDPKSQGEVLELLYDLPITTFISTHNLSMAQELGERAVVLSEEHQIIYDGDINEVLKNEEILIKANLIHSHKHKHKKVSHSHYHKH